MRVAYVCADPGVPVFGNRGSSIHVQEIIGALRRLGADVELFAARTGGRPPASLVPVPLHRLPRVPKDAWGAGGKEALEANQALRNALRCADPFDIVLERYSLWSFAGMEHARDAGASGVLEVNAPLVEEEAQYRMLVDRAGADQFAQRAFDAADVLIAVSAEVAAYLENRPGVQGRVHVVPNGVNPDRFPAALLPSLPAMCGVFTIGFVGSMKPWHGLPILVEAFDIVHRLDAAVRLLVVGDGKERARMVADLADRGLLEAVHFAGAVAPNEVPGLLASMEVAVAPYPSLPHFYFSPLKVYEYMAAGLPVVASRAGQLAELIQDGVNGLLSPPGDAAALAAALQRLKREPDLRVRLGQAARRDAKHQHTWEAVTHRILQLAQSDRADTRRRLEGTGS